MSVLGTIHTFRHPETVNRRIFHAAATVALLSVVVKTAATLKELFVASYFGCGNAVDAFLIAYLVPSFLVTLIAAIL